MGCQLLQPGFPKAPGKEDFHALRSQNTTQTLYKKHDPLIQRLGTDSTYESISKLSASLPVSRSLLVGIRSLETASHHQDRPQWFVPQGIEGW